MELWKLLFILVVVSALGTFGVFAKWRDHMRGKPFGLHRSHLRHVNYEGFGGGFGVGFGGGFGVGANGGFGDAIEPNFGSVGVDDKKMKNEGFYGGGFGVGFNGGFGVGANGGFGDAIEPNFGSVGVDDKKNNRVVSESFYGGGHGGGGHGGGGHGGGGGHHGGTWHGPGGYGGPNQGTWRGWGGDRAAVSAGWYGWSYPWAWYGPVDIAVVCYSDADCDKKSFCASNGYCSRKAVDTVVPVGVADI
jgi:hypothetical protein